MHATLLAFSALMLQTPTAAVTPPSTEEAQQRFREEFRDPQVWTPTNRSRPFNVKDEAALGGRMLECVQKLQKGGQGVSPFDSETALRRCYAELVPSAHRP